MRISISSLDIDIEIVRLCTVAMGGIDTSRVAGRYAFNVM